MSVLIFLIPLALILSLIGLTAFIWTLRSKQYDDLEGCSKRILFDDDLDSDPDSNSHSNSHSNSNPNSNPNSYSKE